MRTVLFSWIIFISLNFTRVVLAGNDFSWRTDDSIEALYFETELMKGMFVANDGRELGKGFGKHGIRDFTFLGYDLGAPDPPVGGKRRHQGILNLYRVYSSTQSFGSLRDDPARVERLKNGACLTWPASDDRPVAISGTWLISGPARIDLLVEATPSRAIENFEILPAVYLAVHLDKSVYLEGNAGPVVSPVRPDTRAGDPLNYAFHPLGEKARAAQENSGRIHSDWKWKSVVPDIPAALPMLFAGDEKVQVVLMADSDSTSAVCATPLPASGLPADWNSVEQHSALYFSTFGHDVEAGKTYTARIRLMVIETPTDVMGAHLKLYQTFLNDLR